MSLTCERSTAASVLVGWSELNGDAPSLPPTPARSRTRKTETRVRSVSHFICFQMAGLLKLLICSYFMQCDEWNKQTICTRRRGPSFFESPLVPGGNPDYPMLLLPSGVGCLGFSPFTCVKMTFKNLISALT